MYKASGFVLLAAACTSSPQEHKLPSATLTPHLSAAPTAQPCGDDVAWNGDTSPDIRYAFTYDNNGLLTHSDGVVTAGGPDDVTDYAYDSNGDLTHLLDVYGTYGRTEITAAYDPTNGLDNYEWHAKWGTDDEDWTYAMSNFVAPWRPATEVISQVGATAAYTYTLAYDGDGRLVTATPDSGPATTYTYDDQARTITSDTGNGAYHGVYTYDDQYRELSEVWGGTAQGMIDWSEVMTYNNDQLANMTYSSGTAQDPQTLTPVEVDTMRYDCSSSRTNHRTIQFVRPGAARR
jgi:YD repeat-containing protein